MSGRRAKARRRMSPAPAAIPSPAGSPGLTPGRPWRAGAALGVAGGLLAATPAPAIEMPAVGSGSATISRPAPNGMLVDQLTDKLILNFPSLKIAVDEWLRLSQPSAASVALLRDFGGLPSEIFGTLTATGRVFLSNPSGVLFGPSSRVNVGSLLATTLQIRDQDFLAGHYAFSQSDTHPLASVVNEGEISAAPGGFVSFVGPEVMNRGTITARLGTIALGAAEGAVLDLRGDGLINLLLTEPVRARLTGPDGQPVGGATNQGRLSAPGGTVTLSAKQAGELWRTAVNNQGVIEATSLVNHGGVIRLVGEQDGIVMNQGTLDVSAAEAGAEAGSVLLAGQRVGHAGTIRARGADGSPGGRVEVTSAERTVLFSGSGIDASGVGESAGGSVRIWSDQDTVFAPGASILARGGEAGGDGGFVEVSAARNIRVDGAVDVRAPRGNMGTYLIDPATLTIVDGAGPGDQDGNLTADDQILAGDGEIGGNTVAEQTLEGLAATANVILEATGQITVNDLSDNLLNLAQTSGSFRMTSTASGGITFLGPGDEIRTQGGSITLQAQGSGSLANIGQLTSNGGAIVLESATGITLAGAVNAGAGAVTINANTAGSGANDFSMAAGSSISTTDGGGSAVAISVNAAGGGTGGAALRDITTGAGGTISVTTATGGNLSGGSLTQAAGTLLDAGAGGTITLTTPSGGTSGIGTSGAHILTSADTISATTGSGGVFVTESNGASFTATAAGTGEISLTSTTGTLTVGGATSTGSGAITLAADAMTIGANLSSTGALTLKPVSAGTSVGIGDGAAGALNLSTAELDFLQNGFSGITIGHPGGTGAVDVRSYTFKDPITVQSPGAAGSITVNGALATGSAAGETGSITLTAGTGDSGMLTVAAAGAINAQAQAITLTADSVDLSAAAVDSIQSTGAITLQPATGSRPIVVGAAGAATDFALDATEIAALKDGFSGITIGHVAGTGGITISAITFNDPVTLRSPSGGAIAVNGQITGTGDASITLDGSGATTTLNADIVTANQDITISDNVLLGSSVHLDTGAGGGGNIQIDGNTDGAFNLQLTAGTGTITFANAVGSVTPLGTGTGAALTISSGATTFNGTLATAAGISQANAAGAITFREAVTTAAGDTPTTFDGSVVLDGLTFTGGGAVTFGNAAADTLTLSGGPVTVTTAAANAAQTYEAAVDGAQNLTLDAGAGTTTFRAAVGASTPLGSFTATASTLTLQDVTAGDIRLDVGGGLTLTNSLTASGGAIRILTGGSLVQTGGSLTAASLGVRAAGPITLEQATNDMDTVALASSAAGTVSYRDADDLSVGTVTAAGSFLATSGVTATNSDILLQAAGPLALTQGVAAGSGTVRLLSGGAVSQSGGAITAASLGVRAAGPITLEQATNDVDTVALASSAAGTVSYRDADDLSVGTVTAAGSFLATSGVSSSANGNISVRTLGGSLSILQNISANGSGSADLQAGGVGSDLAIGAAVSSGSGNLTLTAARDLTQAADVTTGGFGTIGITATTGFLTMTPGTQTTGAGTLTLVSGGNMTVTSATTVTGNMTVTGGGTVTLQEIGAGGNLSVTNSGGVLTLGTGTTRVESAGSLTVTNTGGDVVLAQARSGGNAKVTATGGRILDDGDAGTDDLQVTGNVELITSDYISQAGSDLRVQVTGTLSVSAGSSLSGVSAVLFGTAQDDTIYVPGPQPGLILWNGRASGLLDPSRGAGQAVAAILASPAGQEVFEAVESQMIEVLGDPSEQIEEELFFEEADVAPASDQGESEEQKRRRRQQ